MSARRPARLLTAGRCRLLIALVSLLAVACAPPAEPVRIFAASSLSDALAEVLARFAGDYPDVATVPQLGASSDLARQILAGAPADLFFSADERQLERLLVAGLVAERRDLLSNQLVVVKPRGAALTIASPTDLARCPRLAVADPEAVPAGVYTRRYLEQVGLWQELGPRLVPTLDVRAALAAVASGGLEAGFVYRTDAAIEPRVEIAYAVPIVTGPRIVYPLARLRRGERAPARDLFDFLQSSPARAIFTRHGFLDLAGESASP